MVEQDDGQEFERGRRHVVRMLCQAGVRPRLLLRNPDRLDPEVRDHVEPAVGDRRDADYVAEATRGVEAIFWVHPDHWSLPDPDADAERTGEGFAAAMRHNRIARVVFLSSIGAEMRHGAGFIDGLARIEQRLDAAREETGSALLHLRCGYFMTNLLHDLDGLRAGRLTTFLPLDDPMPWVDPRDIATVATARLLAGDWTGRQVQAVHGPADLTWTEAPPLSTATGVSSEAQLITDDEERDALRAAGMSDVAVEGIVGMVWASVTGSRNSPARCRRRRRAAWPAGRSPTCDQRCSRAGPRFVLPAAIPRSRSRIP